ncbi:MAG TPA: saccharopine dehydrogenase NADP-binding domain-containing protein, partial [Holophagaceae bacterium]|nr:saccharopine dehydrogenase NADP-binding domain-containing protein [Holophagaceae bacterium]
MSLDRVLVLGLGKVGTLVATLLHDSNFKVTGLDAVERKGLPFATKVVDLGDPASLRPLLKDADAVVSCLPFHLNIALSTEAHAAGIHYFDLTEDVPTTNHIRKL